MKTNKTKYKQALEAEIEAVNKLTPGEIRLIDCPTRKFYYDLSTLLRYEIVHGLSVFVTDHSFGKRTGLKVLRGFYNKS